MIESEPGKERDIPGDVDWVAEHQWSNLKEIIKWPGTEEELDVWLAELKFKMRRKAMLIYDCEIKKAILTKGETPLPGIEYCAGWSDFPNMGISCIGVYDYLTDRYRVFCEDNFSEFQKLVDARSIIVGFNSIAFDNRLCAAHGIRVPDEKSYDILVAVWQAAGLAPTFSYPSHLGFGLDNICKVNFNLEKSGHGALAPVQWQRGEMGSVIDYCLNDVRITKKLLDHIDQYGRINDPRDLTNKLQIKRPPIIGSSDYERHIERHENDIIKPQKTPSAGKETVADVVLSDIKERIGDGVRKYGTPLKTFNGRNAMWDAYQEALDLVFYLMQAIMEQGKFFIAKKTYYMEDAPDGQHQVFTEGKYYAVEGYDVASGYMVIDDEGGLNHIGEPGEDFFDEYFEEPPNELIISNCGNGVLRQRTAE